MLIIVNAGTNPANDLDKSPSVPGFITAIVTSATVPLENYTFDTIARATNAIDTFNEDVKMLDECNAILKKQCPEAGPAGGGLTRIDSFISDVSFDHIKDPAQRFWFKNLPTNFYLPPETIDKLTDAGMDLLKQSKAYQDLLAEIGIR